MEPMARQPIVVADLLDAAQPPRDLPVDPRRPARTRSNVCGTATTFSRSRSAVRVRPGGASRRTAAMAPLHAAASALLALGAWTGCAGRSAVATVGPPAHATFNEIFHEVARIPLEEPDTVRISGIEGLVTFPDGRLAMIDEQAREVRIYAPDGALLRVLGHRGSGAAEFESPADLAVAPDGRLYVVDAGRDRVFRWDEELAFDTVFAIRAALEIDPLGSRLAVGLSDEAPPGDEYVVYSAEGERVLGFHPTSPLERVPYWSAMFRNHLAAGREALFVANSMTYPIYRYTLEGEAVDSLGAPPPSYTAPSRPELGQFTAPGSAMTYMAWRHSFTTVHRIALYRDSLLLVEHRWLDPEEVFQDKVKWYRLDIYDVHGGGARKLYEDIPLPGLLLHADSAVYVLLDKRHFHWTIGRYRFAAAERPHS